MNYDTAELATAVGSLIARGVLGVVLMDRPDAPRGAVRERVESEIARRQIATTPLDAPEIWAASVAAAIVAEASSTISTDSIVG